MRKLLNPDGPHMAESVVSKFLPFLEEWYFSYPTPVTCTSTHYSTSTLAARLSTAANAYIYHKYPAKFPHSSFEEVWNNTKLVVSATGVTMEPRNKVVAVTKATPYLVTKTDPTPEEVTALAFLYSRNFFPAPSCLKGNVVNPTTSFPNVGFEEIEPRTYILS